MSCHAEFHAFWIFQYSICQTAKKIKRVIEELDLAQDAIITRVKDSNAKSLDGKNRNMPYIRLAGTSRQELDRIIRAMIRANIGVDTEVEIITDFIPADRMRKT